MANRAVKKKKSQPQGSRTWLWVGLGLILLLAWIVWQSQAARVFSLVEGGGDILVLIRGEEQTSFRIKYTGSQPINLQRIQLKFITGQDLAVHADVTQMALVAGEQNVSLDAEGSVLAGEQFTLQPGDEFEIQMTFSGQSLGPNRLEALLITYLRGTRQRVFTLGLAETWVKVE